MSYYEGPVVSYYEGNSTRVPVPRRGGSALSRQLSVISCQLSVTRPGCSCSSLEAEGFTSDLRLQIPDFRFQISDCRFQIEDFRLPFYITDFWFPIEPPWQPDGQRRKCEFHFFNRQSPITNRPAAAGDASRPAVRGRKSPRRDSSLRCAQNDSTAGSRYGGAIANRQSVIANQQSAIANRQ